MSEIKPKLSRAEQEAAELKAIKEAQATRKAAETAFLETPSFKTAAAPAPAPETAQEAPAATLDVEKEPETLTKPPAARKTSPTKGKTPEPMPWDGLPDYPIAKFSMLFSTVLDAKMVYIGNNLPGGMSKQAMVKQALNEWVEKKLAEIAK